MNKAFLLSPLLLFTQCGTSAPTFPLAVKKRVEVWQPGQPAPQAVLQPGDSVALVESTLFKADSTVLVALPNGKRGYVSVSALPLSISATTVN